MYLQKQSKQHVQLIENEMTILCITVLKLNTCSVVKITTYCNISPKNLID